MQKWYFSRNRHFFLNNWMQTCNIIRIFCVLDRGLKKNKQKNTGF